MYSSKNESVELTSSLIRRPSTNSETGSTAQRSNYFVEKLRKWSEDKDRKIYLLILGATVAMLVWITLLSLQISSLRRTNMHADEIASLRKEIELLRGNVSRDKRS